MYLLLAKLYKLSLLILFLFSYINFSNPGLVLSANLFQLRAVGGGLLSIKSVKPTLLFS